MGDVCGAIWKESVSSGFLGPDIDRTNDLIPRN